MIELERTFLAKEIPEDIKSFTAKEIIDIYYPVSSRHPTLRLRKNGDKYEMTKKAPISDSDASIQEENTIPLTKEEWADISKAPGKKTHKIRYYYQYKDKIAEIDVFQGDLNGLVLVDVEFNNEEEKNSFKMPDFCLVDVTQEEFIAGGMLCGAKYKDLEPRLKEFGYSPLYLNN